MPPIRQTRYTPALPPAAEHWHRRPSESADSTWPAGTRALLLISGAVAPDDAALSRISNDDLVLLRVSMSMLSSGDHTSGDHTSVA